jgi:flagellar basal-body rod protein FlgB
MGPFSGEIIVKALEGLNARMAVAAENIANGGTPGYRPLRVSFEDALAEAARKDVGAVRAVKPQITEAPRADGGVRLDLELATDSATASRYSALVEVLNREFALLSVAGSGNA